jgi:hypothetical protein
LLGLRRRCGVAQPGLKRRRSVKPTGDLHRINAARDKDLEHRMDAKAGDAGNQPAIEDAEPIHEAWDDLGVADRIPK